MSSVPQRWSSEAPVVSALQQAAFDEAPVALGCLTGDGHWLFGNRRLCRLFGVDAATLRQGRLDEAIHPAERSADRELAGRLLAGEIPDYSLTRRFLRRDGSSFYGDQRVSLLPGQADRPSCLVVSIAECGARADAGGVPLPANQLLRALIDHADTLIYACDAAHRFLFVNCAYARLFGTTPQAMIGRRRHDFMPAPAATALEANESQVVKAGTAQRFDEINREADGVHTYLTAKFPIRDPQGAIVAVGGLSTDVTSAARQQADLQQSEARFRAFFDSAMVGMATTSPDRRWLQVNLALCRILGYSRRELQGTNWEGVCLADDLPEYLAAQRSLLAGEIDVYCAEKRLRREDGSLVDVALAVRAARPAGGGVEFLAVTIEDISERKVAEQLLRDQHDFSRCLLAQSPQGILTYREGGQCVLANEMAARITGGSVDALLQQNFHEIAAWRDSGLYAAAQAAFAAPQTVRRTVHLRSSFGKDVWLDCSLAVFVAREEKHLLLIVNDVSERHAAEETINDHIRSLQETNRKLEEAHHQLLQSEKMASIGQLAAGVAHELNNPIGFVHSNLGSLAGYVDDLLRIDAAFTEVEANPGPSSAEALARVRALKDACDHDFLVSDLRQLIAESREGLDRVRKIVQDLKDFSRVGDTGWQWAELHKGLDSTLNIVWNELKYKAEVVRQYGELPEIRCIPSQLNQVFMNLLVNAAQAIEERGHITIRSGHAEDRVWVEVEDDGKGIPPENLQRIFEPFFTTKPVGKGTGLGLSLSWGIVQRHQGTLDVRSECGRGTTFRVTLPIDPPVPSVSAEPS